MRPIEKLVFVDKVNLPENIQCAICFETVDCSGRRWAKHDSSNGATHPLHLDCWKRCLITKSNCPVCSSVEINATILHSQLSANERFVVERRTLLRETYRFIEKVLPPNERFPYLILRNWRFFLVSTAVGTSVLTTVAILYLTISLPQFLLDTAIKTEAVFLTTDTTNSSIKWLAESSFMNSGLPLFGCSLAWLVSVGMTIFSVYVEQVVVKRFENMREEYL